LACLYKVKRSTIHISQQGQGHPSFEISDNGTALFATILPVNEADVYYVYLKYE